MKLIITFYYSCLLLYLSSPNLMSQEKIFFGSINNGGGKQTNSNFIILGSTGETSIEKSAGSGFQVGSGFWQIFPKAIYPSVLNLNADYSFDDVTKTSNYKIIGVPGEADIPIADIITGTEGKKGNWRAFFDPGSGNYLEYDGSDKFNLKPGNAFWLISKSPVIIKRTVNSVVLSADNSYTIALHQGWNLISNPFNKTIDWNIVKNINGVTQPLNDFISGSYSSDSINFEPYKGYYFYNSTGSDSLKIPYTQQFSTTMPKTAAKTANELELFLVSGKIIKSDVKIGFFEKADFRLDKFDIFSPPSQFCDIYISLYNNQLQTDYKYLRADYRRSIEEGQEYNLIIKNSSGNPLELVENGSDNFGDYEIYLMDKVSMKFYNLKTLNGIKINSSPSEKSYSLFVGTKDYLSAKEKDVLPSDYMLYQNYPNPFNPVTRVKFALPVKSLVTLKVYNVLGKQIAVLVNSRYLEAGYHEILFDGSSLSSGVYLYNLTAGQYKSTKKMLIIK